MKLHVDRGSGYSFITTPIASTLTHFNFRQSGSCLLSRVGRTSKNSVVVLSKIRDALLINDAATHGSQFFDVLVLLIYSAGQEIISKIGEAISVLVARMQPHRKAAKAWKVGGLSQLPQLLRWYVFTRQGGEPTDQASHRL